MSKIFKLERCKYDTAEVIEQKQLDNKEVYALLEKEVLPFQNEQTIGNALIELFKTGSCEIDTDEFSNESDATFIKLSFI